MKPQRTHEHYLADILENIDKIEHFVQGVEQKDFAANDEKQYAVVHALQTIGEAGTPSAQIVEGSVSHRGLGRHCRDA